MPKMLINATQSEELRVATTRNDILFDLDIEPQGFITKKANIYCARITRIEPGLEAAFVDFGSTRQGFLPRKEIAAEYHLPYKGEGRPNIRDIIKEGQELLIQVDKEERGTKGAALTTYITLAGCYLVLMVNNPEAGGISRRIEGEERDELRSVLEQLQYPQHMGVIIRTAGVGKSLEDLQWDLDVLLTQWDAIQKAKEKHDPPHLIHEDGDVIIRSIRDNLRRDVDEIIVDHPEIYVKVKNYIEQVKPDYVNRVKLYQDTIPLFNRYHIESQIEKAYQRDITLPSGGSIVIDRTEALVSIDINSAKSTRGSDIEATALHTNLEASEEIARQLRIRDLGGLIVIDFIDMMSNQNQRAVENKLRDAVKEDRARIQISRISRFGLLEMSRQRLRLSLGETTQIVCQHCDGRGTTRGVQSLALAALRLIEDEALKQNTGGIQAQFPVTVATFLLNEKRGTLEDIEKRHNVRVMIIPNPHLETPHFHIKSLRADERTQGKSTASYDLVDVPEPEIVTATKSDAGEKERPAIEHIAATLPERKRKEKSLLQRLWRALFGETPKKAEKPAHKGRHQHRRHAGHQQRHRHGGGNRRRRDGGGGHKQRRHRPHHKHHSHQNRQQNDRHSQGNSEKVDS